MSELNDKQRVALHAADFVESGMCVGLGTGSTANYFIEELARKQSEGLSVVTVSSSIVSAIKAKELGLKVIAIEQMTTLDLDLYVDGADEVLPNLTLLKGRGSDLVREKLLAKASKQMIVMVDNSKRVARIGEQFPIPIEVMPFAWKLVQHSVQEMGGRGGLRPNASGDGLAVSSHVSRILDMTFNNEMDVRSLNQALNAIPGIVEQGIFYDLATTVLIAHEGKVSVETKQ